MVCDSNRGFGFVPTAGSRGVIGMGVGVPDLFHGLGVCKAQIAPVQIHIVDRLFAFVLLILCRHVLAFTKIGSKGGNTQTHDHCQCHQKCDDSFHCVFLLSSDFLSNHIDRDGNFCVDH